MKSFISKHPDSMPSPRIAVHLTVTTGLRAAAGAVLLAAAAIWPATARAGLPDESGLAALALPAAPPASLLDAWPGTGALLHDTATAPRLLSYTTVDRIHRSVNESTRYVGDEALYGRREFWTVAQGAGDCEDYALAKRALLLRAGADLAHLRLVTAWIASGEYHLVLVASTERGEYVLDARHPRPMARQELEALGYRWHVIEERGRWFTVL